MRNLRCNFVKLLLAAVILTGIYPTWAADSVRFPDVPQNAWYIDDLQYILNDSRQIITGYPDGTFRPNDVLTADMYIKLIVTAMGHEVENGKEYWASTYIQKAIEEGYVVPDVDIWIARKRPEDQYFGIQAEYAGRYAQMGRAI